MINSLTGIAFMCGVSFLLSAGLTGAVRRYAIARALLDQPNERSSHSVPTPRGGGLALVSSVLVGTALGRAAGLIDESLCRAVMGSALPVAIVGWIDDRRGLTARLRFGVHLTAASWVIWQLGGLPSLRLGEYVLSLGVFGDPLACLGLVWAINFYNFMDGIDGIAASQAVIVGAAGGALLLWSGDAGGALMAGLIACSSAGFLLWNWPPARIFMGDVGSGSLGLLLGTLALWSERQAGPPLVLWAVLLGVFIGDATVTLIRRILAGERWYAPHRSHAYQRAVAALGAHRPVTLSTCVVTIVLSALSWWAWTNPAALPIVIPLALALLAGAHFLVERLQPMRNMPCAVRSGERE